ncbi:MAG: DUF2061 domain-containing protein [Flavobacteriaceae bacterium]|jgi:uncharacterized membrane protein|nr:DUF2061 domain-containing protein [Flavobacteriaceae bacterium]
MKEKTKQQLLFVLKILVWRLISILLMIVSIHLITGNITMATKVTLFAQLVQTIAHAYFEKFWITLIKKEE